MHPAPPSSKTCRRERERERERDVRCEMVDRPSILKLDRKLDGILIDMTSLGSEYCDVPLQICAPCRRTHFRNGCGGVCVFCSR